MEPSDRAQNDLGNDLGNALGNDALGSGEPTHEIGMAGDSDDWLRFVLQNFS